MTVISFVIPHYNEPEGIIKNLKRFLICVEEKDRGFFEFIIVDDLSDTGQLALIKEFCNKNSLKSCIFIENKENSGPGVARNIGLKNVSGEYVYFLDSDDVLLMDYIYWLEKIYRFREDKVLPDIIFTKYKVGRKKLAQYKLKYNDQVRDEVISLDETLKGQLMITTINAPWAKFYKRDFIMKNNISYPSIYRGEDFIFTRNALIHSKYVYFSKEITYQYINNNPNSLTSLNRKNPERNNLYSIYLELFEGKLPNELFHILSYKIFGYQQIKSTLFKMNKKNMFLSIEELNNLKNNELFIYLGFKHKVLYYLYFYLRKFGLIRDEEN